MTTSHLKYDQPDSGDGIATETFTEDGITKHYQRFTPGWKPVGSYSDIYIESVGPHPEILDINYSGEDNWTASGGGDSSYYWTGGDEYDFDTIEVIHMLYLSGASALTLGTLGSLSAGEYAIGDNDTLGYDTVYIRQNDPDAQVTGYYQMHYAHVCAGASKVVVSSFFSVGSESIVVHPIIYLGSVFNPVILDAVTLTETGETWTDIDSNMAGDPGNGFVFDTYGAMAFGFLVTTAPATGYCFLEASIV